MTYFYYDFCFCFVFLKKAQFDPFFFFGKWQVGCGSGSTLFPLMAAFPNLYVHACDLSPHAIALVKVIMSIFSLKILILIPIILLFYFCHPTSSAYSIHQCPYTDNFLLFSQSFYTRKKLSNTLSCLCYTMLVPC